MQMPRCTGPLGKELAARRRAAGLTQIQLAQRAGVGRTAVQYWEAAQQLDPHGWAVGCMAKVLGWHMPDYCSRIARTRGQGDSPDLRAEAEAAAALALESWRIREARKAATSRVICGATTRKNTKCKNKSEPGRRRCKFHGGMSTGARTPEGIERIRQAQLRRWARARAGLSIQAVSPAVTHDLGA